MLAGIAGGNQMFDTVMIWLRLPGNLDILKAAFAFLASVIGAAWIVWTYLDKKREERIRQAAVPLVPASERWYNRPPRPVRNAVSSVHTGLAIAVIAVIASTMFGIYSYHEFSNQRAKTITSEIKVCRGQDSTRCGEIDEFIGCSNPDEWAARKCTTFSQKVLRSVGGGQCGWTVYEYTCSQKLQK
jgi:hypothetical protein